MDEQKRRDEEQRRLDGLESDFSEDAEDAGNSLLDTATQWGMWARRRAKHAAKSKHNKN